MIKNIKIDSHIFDKITVNGVSYCEIAGKALEGDTSQIQLLSTIRIDGGVGLYQHGAILIEVIDKVGEVNYVRLLKSIPDEDRRELNLVIMGGFDYTTNPKFKRLKFADSFPTLFQFLK